MLSKLLLTEDQEEAAGAQAPRGVGVYSKSRIKARTKQNLWNVKQERPELFRANKKLEQQQAPVGIIPPGFEPCGQEGWLWHPGRNIYLEVESGNLYWLDKAAGEYRELAEGVVLPYTFTGSGAVNLGKGATPASSSNSTVGVVASPAAITSAVSSSKPPAPRHVIIPDLHRTAQVLKLDLEHLDRPAALLAVYGVATGECGAATEAATCGLHERLIKQLAAHRGPWSDQMLCDCVASALSTFAAEHGNTSPLLTVALVVGNCLVTLASSGACCAFLRADGKEAREVAAVPQPEGSDKDKLRRPRDVKWSIGSSFREAAPAAPQEVAAATGASSSLRQLAMAPSCHRLAEALPEAGYVLLLAGEAEVTSEVQPMVDEVLSHLFAGRPKAASVAVLRAARTQQASGSLVAACARLGPPLLEAPGGVERPAKRAKTEEPAPHMVRVRQILLRHWKGSGTEPVDPIRRRSVRRSPEEAELQMLQVLEGLVKDGIGSFSSACKASSECQSALKGGELAGDVGWLDKEKALVSKQADRAVKSAVPPLVLKAAFDLEVGQLGDLVTSDVGTHLLLRTA